MSKKKLILLFIIILVFSSFGNLFNIDIGDEKATATILTVNDDGGANYTSIQEAIDNATSGDTIYVWAGIYNESIIINKSLTLIGNGTDKTWINGTGVGSVVSITAAWVNISRFNLIGSGSGSYDACIKSTTDYCRIENINCSDSPNGIYLGIANYNIIRNCFFTNNTIGINLYDSDHNDFVNNIIFKNNNYGFYLYFSSNFNIIRNNYCSGNQYNFYISQNCQYNRFETNTYKLKGIKTTWNEFDYWLLQNSNSNTFSNNTGGGFNIQSSTSNNFLNNTMHAGGIQISANQYAHWVQNFDDNNTVFGKIVIYWISKNSTMILKNIGQAFLINCQNITVKNTKFENLTNGITLAYSNKNIVENNIFMNNDRSMFLSYSDENLIINNVCNLNENDGIFISSSNSNIIVNNTCNSNKNNGITIYNSESNSIEKSILKSNTYDGIYEYRSIENVYVNNTSINNLGNGMYSYYCNEGIISNNNFSFNNLNGINLRGTANHDTITGGIHIIKDNVCTFNNGSGINNQNSNNNSIINNNCNNNKDSGIIILGNVNIVTWVGKENTLENNICNYNTKYGIYLYQATENQIINSEFNSNNLDGVFLVSECMLNDFCNNEIISNRNGISLSSSDSSKFKNNTIINNVESGILLITSNGNTFVQNNCSKNRNGIILQSDSDSNTIFGNDFTLNSNMGISLGDKCTNNRIFHNNIIFNTIQGEQNLRFINYWQRNDEGNFWSDYVGLDNGAAGRILGDCIGDTNIPHLGLDHYPFIKSSGWTYPGIPILLDPGDFDTDGTFILNWTECRNAIGYIVRVSTEPTFEKSSTIYNGQEAKFKVKNYDEGIIYFRVRAYNDDLKGDWSNIINISINYHPKKPQGLEVLAIPEGNELNISWILSSGDVVEYILYYKLNESTNWEHLATIAHPENIYYHKGLLNGEIYYYRLRANDSLGSLSDYSTIVSGIPKDSIAPVPPIGLVIKETSIDSISLAWNKSSESDVVGYNIYRSKSSNPKDWGEPVNGDKLVTSTFYTNKNLTEDTKYYYTITANDEVPNESEFSVIVMGETVLGLHGPEIKNPKKDFKVKEDTVDSTSINLLDWFMDRNNDITSYECKGQIHLIVTIFKNNGTVILEPEKDWNGKEILNFFAYDSNNNFVYDDVIITVTPVNDPPGVAEIFSPKEGHKVNDSTSIQFKGDCTDPDLPDHDDLKYSWSSNISGKVGTGKTLTTTIKKPGHHEITLTVTDSGGLVSKSAINITITKSPIDGDPEEPDVEKPKEKKDEEKDDTVFIISLVVGGLIIIILIIILFLILRKKPSMDEEEEEDIEDEELEDEELEDEELEDEELVDEDEELVDEDEEEDYEEEETDEELDDELGESENDLEGMAEEDEIEKVEDDEETEFQGEIGEEGSEVVSGEVDEIIEETESKDELEPETDDIVGEDNVDQKPATEPPVKKPVKIKKVKKVK